MRDYSNSNGYVFLMDATKTFLQKYFLTFKSQFHLGYINMYIYIIYIYVYYTCMYVYIYIYITMEKWKI